MADAGLDAEGDRRNSVLTMLRHNAIDREHDRSSLMRCLLR